MKKVLMLSVLALLVVSTLCVVSATTIIAGKVYNHDYSQTIANATVEVTCNNNLKITSSLNDGSYAVTYCESTCQTDPVCDDGDTLSVYAEKDGLTGSNSGVINDDMVMDIDIGIVNVPLVPEFGIFIGALTILSALGVFFLVRRK